VGRGLGILHWMRWISGLSPEPGIDLGLLAPPLPDSIPTIISPSEKGREEEVERTPQGFLEPKGLPGPSMGSLILSSLDK